MANTTKPRFRNAAMKVGRSRKTGSYESGAGFRHHLLQLMLAPLFLFAAPQFAGALEFHIGMGSTTPGHTMVIPILASGAPANLSAFCIFLTNSPPLGLPTVGPGSAQPNLVAFVDDFGGGVFRLTCFVTNDPPIQDGELASLSYSVPHGTPPGRYPLELPDPPSSAPPGPNPESRALGTSELIASIGSGTQFEITPAILGSSPTRIRSAGMTLKIPLADLVTEVDHNPLTLHFGASVQGAILSADDKYVYYRPVNQSDDIFTYTASNGLGDSTSGAVTVQVLQVGGLAQTVSSIGSEVTIRFAGIPGYTYEVQFSSDLAGAWATVATITAPVDGVFTFTDTPPSGLAFYRLAQH